MMCKKLICLMSVLVLSFVCTSYADTVIGDWENGSYDSWIDWGAGQASIESIGAPKYTFSPIGATLGNSALKVSPGSGWQQNLSISLADIGGLEAFMANKAFSIDVTYNSADWDPATTFAQVYQVSFNNNGYGWNDVGGAAASTGMNGVVFTDTLNPDSPGAIPLVNPGIEGTTVTGTWTWDYSGVLDRFTLPDTDAYIQIVIATNSDGAGAYYFDNARLTGAEPEPEPEPTVPFSLKAAGDIELGNDPQVGPDQNSNGSGLGARDIPDRRRVILISYDISSLKGRGPVSNVSFNNFSHDQHGEVNVYGIIEDLDLLDVESLTWNTAPGVQNDPTLELNSPVALDLADLSDVLLTFSGPGQTGVRFSTGTSQALDDFINNDTDGIVTFLIAPSTEGNQLIVRSREHSAGGTFLEGQIAPIAKIIYVTSVKDNDMDGVQDDISWNDWLTAEGYDVDFRPGNWIDPLDPNKIAELEAADLIIASRGMATGEYDGDETAKWNNLTTPIICTNAWMIRSNRWVWMNSTAANKDAGSPIMLVLEPDHPIFVDVPVDQDGLVEVLDPDVASGNTSFLNDILDPGNGTLLAQSLGIYNTAWIVEWPAGVEYYAGAGQIAGGPRLLLMAGTQDDPYLAPDGVNIAPVGVFNLNEAGQQLLRNALEYLLPAAPVTPTHLYTFEDGTAKDEIDSADGTLVGGAEIIDGAMVTTAQDQWMEMPGDVIAMNTYSEVTIEAWYIPTAGANTSWSMLAYFGDSVNGLGSNGFFITSARGDDKSRAAISIGDEASPWASESGADGPEIDDGLLHQMASTIDGVDITLYIDGVLIASTPLSAANQISGISQNYAYLAKGGYTGDPEWIGAIEQFAIYDVALSAKQIAADYAAGLIK
jgi:hypothetical protein